MKIKKNVHLCERYSQNPNISVELQWNYYEHFLLKKLKTQT